MELSPASKTYFLSSFEEIKDNSCKVAALDLALGEAPNQVGKILVHQGVYRFEPSSQCAEMTTPYERLEKFKNAFGKAIDGGLLSDSEIVSFKAFLASFDPACRAVALRFVFERSSFTWEQLK